MITAYRATTQGEYTVERGQQGYQVPLSRVLGEREQQVRHHLPCIAANRPSWL
jgi:hypothetical protein